MYHHLIFCREKDLREVLAININPVKDRVTYREGKDEREKYIKC